MEVSKFYKCYKLLLKCCARLTMTIGEIFDCSYTSQTKGFEILDSNRSRPTFFNLLVFWSSIIVITCLIQCFGWTWSYFILILETWPRVFGSLDINNDEEEN